MACIKQEHTEDLQGPSAALCEPHCENGGRCTVKESHTFCVCPRGFSGDRCGQREDQRSPMLSMNLTAIVILAVTGTLVITLLLSRGLLNM